jgi:hypothetical protein
MFSVVDGKVEEVKSIFGQQALNRDGVMTTITDGPIALPDSLEDSSVVIPSGRALNPKGYV